MVASESTPQDRCPPQAARRVRTHSFCVGREQVLRPEQGARAVTPGQELRRIKVGQEGLLLQRRSRKEHKVGERQTGVEAYCRKRRQRKQRKRSN